MIKALLAGAVIGIVGKKLFDEGKLDPYVESFKSKAEEFERSVRNNKPAARAEKASAT
jgi:hypothetical protein